jgi:hypothetical protein
MHLTACVRSEDDLRTCLKRYENLSGKSIPWSNLDKALLLPKRNPSDHPFCLEMFERAGLVFKQQVWQASAAIARAFGYSSCCTPRKTLNSNRA